MDSNSKYVGTVIDRMTGETVYASKPQAVWGDAQRLAERHAQGDRYSVKVLDNDITRAASAFGRLGGSAKSAAKTRAAKENGKKGGRPKKKVAATV